MPKWQSNHDYDYDEEMEQEGNNWEDEGDYDPYQDGEYGYNLDLDTRLD